MARLVIDYCPVARIFRLCFSYRHWKKAYAVGSYVTPEVVDEYEAEARTAFDALEREHEEKVRRKWQ
jgi:hypothetical protein